MRESARPLPVRITLVLILVLITAVWNLIRLWASVILAGVLEKYSPWPGPAYIGITGAVFGGLGLALCWGIWRRARWAPLATLGGAAGYAAWSWLDQLFIQPQLSSGWLFWLGVTAIAVGFVAVVALDPRNRLYFGKEAHEREEQDRSAS